MSEMGFQLQKLKRCQFSMAFVGVNTTPVMKVLNPKSCRLCGASVANGGYYSLTSDTAEKLSICSRISSLFGVEENLSVGPRVLCKKCFRRIERFEVTLKELSSFKSRYIENLLLWKEEGEEARSKRCSSSPGFGVKKSRGPSSSVTSVVPGSSGKNIRRALDIPPNPANNATPNNVADDIMELTLHPEDIEVILSFYRSLSFNMRAAGETGDSIMHMKRFPREIICNFSLFLLVSLFESCL